jgi:outer membrane protein TolC
MVSLKILSTAHRLSLPYLGSLLHALALFWPLTLPAAQNPLSFNEALSIAVRDSSLLSAQRSAIAAAEEATVSARELPDPKLKFGVDNFPLDGPDRYSFTRDFMTMRRIGVAQEFPRSEKREIKGRRAEHQLAREQAMLGDTRAGVRRDVAMAWMERYYAEQMAKIVEAQYAETVLQRDALQAGVAASRTTLSERIALESTLQMLLNRRTEFDKQGARAQAMLARWLGEAAKRPLADLPDAANATPAEVHAQSGGIHAPQHPHLQTLERQIDIAQSEADLAKAATKPDWGLEISYAQRSSAYSNMLNVQVSIDLPLFADRRQNRETVARLAQVEQARALREDALRSHLAEAAAAQAEWDAASVRLKRFDDALLPLARDNATVALAAYRGGLSTLAAVLEARRMELDLQLQKLQLAAEQGRARAQLIYFLPEEYAK